MDLLQGLLGKRIEYYSDEGKWEEVYLVGFDSGYGGSISVFPPDDTEFGKQWHMMHQPRAIFIDNIKVTDPARLRLLAIESEQQRRIQSTQTD